MSLALASGNLAFIPDHARLLGHSGSACGPCFLHCRSHDCSTEFAFLHVKEPRTTCLCRLYWQIDIFRPLTNNTCLLLGAQPGFPEATSARRIFAVLVALAGVVGAAVGYCSTLLDWQARSSPHSRQLLCSRQHINLRGFGFLRLGSRIQIACRWTWIYLLDRHVCMRLHHAISFCERIAVRRK